VRSGVEIEVRFKEGFGHTCLWRAAEPLAAITRRLIVLLCLCVISQASDVASSCPGGSPGTQVDLALSRSTSQFIVIGFLGGFVAHDEPHHPEVRMIEALKRDYSDKAYFGLLENKKIDKAYALILHRLDVDYDGAVSDEEKRQACIQLFGHSWGASAVVTLARKLERKGIPVRLTVQVDSVAKPFHNDSLIPSNVLQAANFYQPHGLIHGESKIVAADPSRTTILGNFRVDYHHEPPECRDFPWHARFFTKAHIEIECDPKIWSKVEILLRGQLPSLQVTQTSAKPETAGLEMASDQAKR